MSRFEVRYADSFRCIDAETTDAARAIAVGLDPRSTIVEVAEIARDEDSLFYKLFHSDDDLYGMHEERRRHP